MNIGYFPTSEEWGPRELVALAGEAERAGSGLKARQSIHRLLPDLRRAR